MRLAIATVLLSCAVFAQSSQPKALSSQDAALIANSRAVLEAQKTKNVDALKQLLSPDFQGVNSAGAMQKADDLLGDAKESKLKNYRVYNEKVLPVDDGAEIVTFDAVIEMPEGDDYLAPRYQHFSDLWVKQGDQWKLKFEQASAVRHID
jgi:hypothetical protein